jgi:beta-carotene 3-hydroxylase
MFIYLIMAIVMVSAFLFLEFEAEYLHRQVWHKRLWFLHQSHHSPKKGRFEKNDLLSFVHAPIAIFFLFFGILSPNGILSVQLGWLEGISLAIGLGMTMFGVGYIAVHDGLVHDRLPFGFLARFTFFDEVRKAHWVHHEWTDEGHPFGLFLGPRTLRKRKEKATKD